LISTDVNEPYQPILESYNPRQYSGESSKRDFSPVLYETFPWLSLNKSSKSFECFPCQKFYPVSKSFLFSNWRKPQKLHKHCKSKSHEAAIKKWINLKINLKQQSSVLSKVHYFHEEEIKKNRVFTNYCGNFDFYCCAEYSTADKCRTEATALPSFSLERA